MNQDSSPQILISSEAISRRKRIKSFFVTMLILGGLIYSVSENFDLDFGVKFGLNKPETDFAILAGIALRF